MATFVELVQDLARESGTEPNIGDPATLSGVTGRKLRMKHFVADAWREIQRIQDNWRWMYAQFSDTTISGTRDYDASAMGLTPARFSRWAIFDEEGQPCITSYLTANGQDEEAFLTYAPWAEFYRTYLVGEAASKTGKPQVVTVDPNRSLQFYPIPDDSYTIRGRYYKAPQVLSDDSDTPECPAEYHDAIKWLALVQLAVFDENREQLPAWQNKYMAELTNLRNGQLPPINMAGPLA